MAAPVRSWGAGRIHCARRRAARWTNRTISGPLLDQVAAPDEGGRALMTRAAEAGGLTARGWTRALRLARTIADLDGSEAVRRRHVAEALIYRRVSPSPPFAARLDPVLSRGG